MSTRIQNFSKRLVCQTAATLLVLLVATLTYAGQNESLRRPDGVYFDGETVFRGIFFGSAPVAQLFPEVWNHPGVLPYRRSLTSAKTRDIQERVIKYLETTDPTFFQGFGADLQSGDHLRIEHALQVATTKLREAVTDGLKLNPATIASSDVGILEVSVDVFAISAGIILVIAVVDAAVLWIDIYIWSATTAVGQSGGALRREIWVDLMAQRLGPA